MSHSAVPSIAVTCLRSSDARPLVSRSITRSPRWAVRSAHAEAEQPRGHTFVLSLSQGVLESGKVVATAVEIDHGGQTNEGGAPRRASEGRDPLKEVDSLGGRGAFMQDGSAISLKTAASALAVEANSLEAEGRRGGA